MVNEGGCFMKNRTCCFTGHRDLPENCKAEITARLEIVIVSLIQSGYLYFGAGGALGFDYEKKKVMQSEILETVPDSSR